MESNFESRNELVKIGEPKPNLVDWFVFFFKHTNPSWRPYAWSTHFIDSIAALAGGGRAIDVHLDTVHRLIASIRNRREAGHARHRNKSRKASMKKYTGVGQLGGHRAASSSPSSNHWWPSIDSNRWPVRSVPASHRWSARITLKHNQNTSIESVCYRVLSVFVFIDRLKWNSFDWFCWAFFFYSAL